MVDSDEIEEELFERDMESRQEKGEIR